MQAKPAFSIGIDLGTTNCALSYVDLSKSEGRSVVLSIPQRSDLTTAIESTTLPSFLYRPSEAERSQIGGDVFGSVDGWVVGLAARERALSSPDRVAHSAKSWLCHHTVNLESRILPWKSDSIADAEKLSPLEAASLLLAYLKRCWDEGMANMSPAWRFELQQVTITVPASFDVAAQKATLEAARRAGYPERTKLLEEPQAAFYRWLEEHRESEALQDGRRILILDIGGGTSDFSFFEVGKGEDAASPKIERVAVSDHILLGGDNIDLALAHALESELTEEGSELSPDQWGHLIARAREMKERCLGDGSEEGETLTVAIPGRGSGLMAGTLSAEIPGDAVQEMLLDGFFPACPVSARPDRQSGGLLEWGLPYAPDCAVTRHLADFLRQCGGRVDAVLFNGGTLASIRIQKILIDQIGKWQSGVVPELLDNAETDLSVARGAAAYGALEYRDALRISAGLGRGVYLEVASASGDGSQLLCVLPRGAQPEVVEQLSVSGLRLATNRRARFGSWQGDALGEDGLSDIRSLDTVGFSRLPSLEAEIEVSAEGVDSVAVRLRSSVNELGLLQVECESVDPEVPGSWRLEFNLRGADAADANVGEQADGFLDTKKLDRAGKELKQKLFSAGPKASRILKGLESSLGASRSDWSLPVLRGLSDVVLAGSSIVERSDSHAESWLQLASYCLRPGFGDAGDSGRMDTLWATCSREGKRSARVEVQEAILWRRVAGGLDERRQQELLEREWEKARTRKGATAERIRLLGALEKVDLVRKDELGKWCLEAGLELAKSGAYAAPYFAALGQILSRTPFRAGPEYVLPPERVVEAFERLRKLDWRESEYGELGGLFLRAARLVDDRALDLPERMRRKIVSKLEKSGIAATKVRPLVDYQPLGRAERASLFGEALPVGLMLG
ncbi:hypothetical protein VDG1235_432 [Verrucomicrobiia bacterium DG1235]|nr:hypothetical protein VDG1235_432 [Verrucomicrobiae bacterium DG1235]